MIRLIKELNSFWSFYRKTTPIERRIVFYAEDITSYSYFEGLIKQLTEGENQKICYVTSDFHDPILTEDRSNVHVFYIKSLLAFFTVTLSSEVLIMTMPDLHQLHIRRSERGTHHIYMFHSIGSSVPVYRYGALFHYDAIFCVGPHHELEIHQQEDLYNIPQKTLVKFGYWRLEDIYNNYNEYTPTKNKHSQYKANILLGPSWGENSILNACGHELIKVLLDSNYRVIVRPHPVTSKKSPEVLDALNADYGDRSNYVFANDISTFEAIFESDLLICDWSGIAYEYAFGTERPVLFIDVPQKVVNERYKEVGIEPMDISIRNRIGTIVNPRELDKLDAAIEYLLSNKDSFMREIVKARGEYIYNFGNCSVAGAKYILNFLKQENGDGDKA